jgi:hypothetical protein
MFDELNFILVLFQENKSYGVKTICIDPLSTRCCTSRHEQLHFGVTLLTSDLGLWSYVISTDGQSWAAGGEPCGDPAISHDSHHVLLVQWTICLLPATRDTGSNPLGDLCETRILLLALSRYRTIHKEQYLWTLSKGHRFWVGLLADITALSRSILVEGY